MQRFLLPGIVLALLVGGITVAFLGRSVEGPVHAPGPPAAGGPLTSLAPQMRGLGGGADAEVGARILVDRALEGITGSPRAAILAALRAEDWGAQWAGLMAVPRYGPADVELAAAIRGLLASEARAVRRTAATVAAYVGPGYETLEPMLEQRARDPQPDVRAAALQTLARRTSRAVELWPLFLEALQDAEGDARAAAAHALSRIELQEALPAQDLAHVRRALVVAMRDVLPDVRMYAVMALGRVGPQAAPDVPAMVALLGDESTLVRGTVATALGSIGVQAIPAIEARLAEDDGALAASLLWSLRLIGAEALPALRRATSHRAMTVRIQAAFKLYELGAGAAQALPLHIEALRSGDIAAMRLAARNLARIGTESAPARAALEALRDHEDETVRAAVRAALARL